MKPRTLIRAVVILMATFSIAGAQDQSPLRVVPSVDLNRYSGQWYEIARLPNRFQKRCTGNVTAEYALQKDGKLSVLNRCRIEDGDYIQARGVAKLAGKRQPSSALKVRFAPAILSFIPQVWGDYQIIALAPDYAHAVVGDPDRKYLWILSRTPAMNGDTYTRLVEAARVQGFPVEQLERTSHPDS